MGHLAGFLAVNGLGGPYENDYPIGEGPRGADLEVAYGVASATAFAEHFQQPFLFDRRRFLGQYPDGEAKTLGLQWGREVGAFIVRDRTNDGAEPSKVDFYLSRYPRRQDALRWTPTGPLFDSGKAEPAFAPTFHRGLLPGFGKVKPWTMKSLERFRVPDFPDPASPEFAADYAEIKELGASESNVRTPEQSEIAFFWEDGPWAVTPPGHFSIIAMQLLQHRRLSLVEMARAMALISIAMADAGISTWDSKYRHDVIRPETAIRYRAPEFGNSDPRVAIDSNWQSLIPTPPFPTYTSGHSAFGGAGCEMIALLLGRDDIAFSGSAPDTVTWPEHLSGVVRYWPSLSAAAEENGASRLYGGVHWNADNVQGLRVGREIARHAFGAKFKMKA